MPLLKLTSAWNGRPVWIASAHVQAMQREPADPKAKIKALRTDNTRLDLVAQPGECIGERVMETPEQILAMLEVRP